MTTRTTLLLTLGVLGCCGALPAQSQAQAPMQIQPLPPQAQYDRGMPFDDVVAMVRSMDLDPVAAPIRRGTRYVVRAVDRYGTMVRVVVDGQLARIVAMAPMGRRARNIGYAPPDYAPPGYAPPGYAPPGYGPPPSYNSRKTWRAPRNDDDDDIDVNIDEDRHVPQRSEMRRPSAEVPSVRADAPAMRPAPGPQARLSPAPLAGPNVIYADPNRAQEPLPADRIHEPAPPHASGIGRSLSVAKPPMPRPRPEEAHAALQSDALSEPVPSPAVTPRAEPPAVAAAPPSLPPSPSAALANDDAPIPPAY